MGTPNRVFFLLWLWFCSIPGLSLKSQELTALFLAVRLYCSFVMEYDIHTILDTAAFITTCWVIYTIRYKLKPTYRSGLDNFSNYLVVRSYFLFRKRRCKIEVGVFTNIWVDFIWSYFSSNYFIELKSGW